MNLKINGSLKKTLPFYTFCLYKNCETKVILSLGYFHLCINILYTLIMNDKECIDKFIKVIIINKKHIDASVKERPQTLLVPSEEICKRVLCNIHI